MGNKLNNDSGIILHTNVETNSTSYCFYYLILTFFPFFVRIGLLENINNNEIMSDSEK